jgi:hypothetical protein
MTQGAGEVAGSRVELENQEDARPAPEPTLLQPARFAAVITEISDEDYRCVWRPCHELEEEEVERGENEADEEQENGLRDE